MSPEEWVRDEIRRIRDWRHDTDKRLQALALLKEGVESLAGSQAAIERRLVKVEEDVRQLATADAVADAVKSLVWKAAVAVGAAIVGAATIAGVIAAWLVH